MSFKQAIGFIILSVGIILVLFALNGMGYLPTQRTESVVMTNSPLSPSEHMPVMVAQTSEKCSRYPILTLIGGILLMGAGGWIAIRFKE